MYKSENLIVFEPRGAYLPFF